MKILNDRTFRRRFHSAGQAMILIVITFMGLLLFLGLMVDLGQIFIAKGYLRRAADAGALAAAAQFRENRGIDEMEAAAREVAHMNGMDPDVIMVQTCQQGDPGPGGSLCPETGTIPRKLVRVTVELDYPMTFISLLGITNVHLVESSVSEAAAMDVVLVIDVSESMTWDSPANSGLPYDDDPRNPAVCNTDNTCHPFQEVKSAAALFASQVLNRNNPDDEEDRLAIVTFANGWQSGMQGTYVHMGWTNNRAVALDYINGSANGLKVYNPNVVCPYGLLTCPEDAACPATVDDIPISACLYYTTPDPLAGKPSTYGGLHCPRTLDIDTKDGGHWTAREDAISACGTTDIGGGLRLAGMQFSVEKRQNALWVVVMLTDGAANATLGLRSDITDSPPDELIFPWHISNPADLIDNLPFGFCPSNAWVSSSNRIYCQDESADSRHGQFEGAYDADDFARDQADFVGCYATDTAEDCTQPGQGAVLFTIGLGNAITDVLDTQPIPEPYGGSLLRYIAAVGDDGDPASDPCASETDFGVSCGNYFFAQGGADLMRVFELIYSRIFTRLTQ